jgi:hypothetical protein
MIPYKNWLSVITNLSITDNLKMENNSYKNWLSVITNLSITDKVKLENNYSIMSQIMDIQ